MDYGPVLVRRGRLRQRNSLPRAGLAKEENLAASANARRIQAVERKDMALEHALDCVGGREDPKYD